MDNRYKIYNCPALMNDGRFISNYVRSSTFDQYIRYENNIDSSHEYRHYLQNNGNIIINNIKNYYYRNNTCNVEGLCLPMDGIVNTADINKPIHKVWYNENDFEDNTLPIQLDFMMFNNNINSCKT